MKSFINSLLGWKVTADILHLKNISFPDLIALRASSSVVLWDCVLCGKLEKSELQKKAQ